MTDVLEQTTASIHTLLNPRSIAIVGATPKDGYGGRFLRAVVDGAEGVSVYPVNPGYTSIWDIPCYASIEDVPEVPDLVGVVVSSAKVLPTLRASHTHGVRAAVVIAGGFAERGSADSQNLQEDLAAFARDSGMRICGPNCLGFANVRKQIWTYASQTRAIPGSIGVVCQSGATAFATLGARAVDLGIGLSYVISTGNEADLDFADFARYLIEDPATRVIIGLVEGFKAPDKFRGVARLAAERGKPIVLVKIGRSVEGSRAARSHTAAMTGVDKVWDAVLRQDGVVRVQDYDELLEVGNLLANAKKPLAPGIAVASQSGGLASLTTDLCSGKGIAIPSLSARGVAALSRLLDGRGSAANPADVTSYMNRESFPEIMEVLLGEPEVGTLVIAGRGRAEHAGMVAKQRDASSKPVVYLWSGSRSATAGLPELKAARVPIFYNPTSLANGLRHVRDYHAWLDARGKVSRTGLLRTVTESGSLPVTPHEATVLSEHDAKALVSSWGLRVTNERRVSDPTDAVTAARELRYPVVLSLSRQIYLTEPSTAW